MFMSHVHELLVPPGGGQNFIKHQLIKSLSANVLGGEKGTKNEFAQDDYYDIEPFKFLDEENRHIRYTETLRLVDIIRKKVKEIDKKTDKKLLINIIALLEEGGNKHIAPGQYTYIYPHLNYFVGSELNNTISKIFNSIISHHANIEHDILYSSHFSIKSFIVENNIQNSIMTTAILPSSYDEMYNMLKLQAIKLSSGFDDERLNELAKEYYAMYTSDEFAKYYNTRIMYNDLFGEDSSFYISSIFEMLGPRSTKYFNDNKTKILHAFKNYYLANIKILKGSMS